jgi:hypothetical protein
VVLACALSELAVRVVNPAPRTQIVAAQAVEGMRWADGVPLWRQTGSDAREEPACAPGATEVLLVGSSITFGIRMEAADTVGARLQRVLSSDGSAWCVRSVAQPAYTGEQKRVAVEAGIARWHPRVVVFEVWNNDGGDYVQVGDQAVATGGLRRDADGWPAPPLPLPTWLHHEVMVRSAAWRYATIALAGGGPDPGAWTERVPARLDRVVDAAGADARVVVWLAARLNRPFAEQAAGNPGSSDYGEVLRWGAARGVPVVDMAAAWAGRDPGDLGIDACCHLSADGAEQAAEVLAPVVRR